MLSSALMITDPNTTRKCRCLFKYIFHNKLITVADVRASPLTKFQG